MSVTCVLWLLSVCVHKQSLAVSSATSITAHMLYKHTNAYTSVCVTAANTSNLSPAAQNASSTPHSLFTLLSIIHITTH